MNIPHMNGQRSQLGKCDVAIAALVGFLASMHSFMHLNLIN